VTVAGSKRAGFDDGQGTAANFNRPWGLALDLKGNILVADHGNRCIRCIDPQGLCFLCCVSLLISITRKCVYLRRSS